MFSHFGTILACDEWTDKHMTTAYTILAWRRAVKTTYDINNICSHCYI